MLIIYVCSLTSWSRLSWLRLLRTLLWCLLLLRCCLNRLMLRRRLLLLIHLESYIYLKLRWNEELVSLLLLLDMSGSGCRCWLSFLWWVALLESLSIARWIYLRVTRASDLPDVIGTHCSEKWRLTAIMRCLVWPAELVELGWWWAAVFGGLIRSTVTSDMFSYLTIVINVIAGGCPLDHNTRALETLAISYTFLVLTNCYLLLLLEVLSSLFRSTSGRVLVFQHVT